MASAKVEMLMGSSDPLDEAVSARIWGIFRLVGWLVFVFLPLSFLSLSEQT